MNGCAAGKVPALGDHPKPIVIEDPPVGLVAAGDLEGPSRDLDRKVRHPEVVFLVGKVRLGARRKAPVLVRVRKARVGSFQGIVPGNGKFPGGVALGGPGLRETRTVGGPRGPGHGKIDEGRMDGRRRKEKGPHGGKDGLVSSGNSRGELLDPGPRKGKVTQGRRPRISRPGHPPVEQSLEDRGKVPGEIGGRGEIHFLVGRVQGNPGVSFPVFGAPGGSIIDPGLHPQVFHADPADPAPGGQARYGNSPRGGKVQGAFRRLEAPRPIPEGFRGNLDASFHVAAGNPRGPKKGDEKSRDVRGVSPAVQQGGFRVLQGPVGGGKLDAVSNEMMDLYGIVSELAGLVSNKGSEAHLGGFPKVLGPGGPPYSRVFAAPGDFAPGEALFGRNSPGLSRGRTLRGSPARWERSPGRGPSASIRRRLGSQAQRALSRLCLAAERELAEAAFSSSPASFRSFFRHLFPNSRCRAKASEG